MDTATLTFTAGDRYVSADGKHAFTVGSIREDGLVSATLERRFCRCPGGVGTYTRYSFGYWTVESLRAWVAGKCARLVRNVPKSAIRP